MYQKTLTLIVAFASVFFLGYGITGFYALESSSSTICVEDRDCTYATCCPLYEQDYGICAQETQCYEVYLDSRDSGQPVTSQQAPVLAEQAERSYIAVSLGILLLLILAIVGYIEWQQKRTGKKTVKKVRK